MEKIKEKIKIGASALNHEVRNKVAGYITAAFGLVAGLAWNDAIKSLIDYLFPLEKNGLWAKFIYAVLITLVLVTVSIFAMRIFKKEKEEKAGKK